MEESGACGRAGGDTMNEPVAWRWKHQTGQWILCPHPQPGGEALYVIPPGWVVVPAEITPEMIEADIDTTHALRKRQMLGEQIAFVDMLRATWAAMLAAVPDSPSNAGLSCRPNQGASE